jgi:hypothetical protein
MTRTEAAQLVISAVCGAAGALAFALGLPLIVMWIVDSTSSSAGLTELLVGVTCIAVGVLCVSARRWLMSAKPELPGNGERAI